MERYPRFAQILDETGQRGPMKELWGADMPHSLVGQLQQRHNETMCFSSADLPRGSSGVHDDGKEVIGPDGFVDLTQGDGPILERTRRLWGGTSHNPLVITAPPPAELEKERPLWRAVYGPEGFETDIIKRAQREAEQLRVNHAMPEGQESGRGPKPVWTFLDAGPRGWWPIGEWYIGAAPDNKGMIPAPSEMKVPLEKVKRRPVTVLSAGRGISSTMQLREDKDTWLASQGAHHRLAFAISQRLTPQEHERLKFVESCLKFMFVMLIIPICYNIYQLQETYRHLTCQYDSDPKLKIIILDLQQCQAERPKEFGEYEEWFRKTMPIPSDIRAALELEWRELIKMGWIKVEPEFQDWVEEPFNMRWIPGHAGKRSEGEKVNRIKGWLT